MTNQSTEPSAIAAGLTKAQRAALTTLDGQWVAGSGLQDKVLSEVAALRDAGLLERRFLDERPPRYLLGKYQMAVKLSACWHFRLTPLGIAVRDHLLSEQGHD